MMSETHEATTLVPSEVITTARARPAAIIARLTAIPAFPLDLTIALALIGLADLSWAVGIGLTPLHALTVALSLLPLSLRRRWPRAIFVLVGIGLLGGLALGFSDSAAETFGALLATYTAYSHASRRQAAWMTMIFMVALPVSFLLSARNPGGFDWAAAPYYYLLYLLVVALAYGAQSYRAHVRERDRLLAREAVIEERARIARELHDVVAHGVSVMVLQATAGSRIADRDPARAAAALAVIQDTGREALDNLRRVVGVLRSDGDDPELLPQPGLDQLETLVEQVRRAGMAVDLAIRGDRRPLPAGIEVSAYRVIQESLTNVLKHANASRARVALTYRDRELIIEIADDGRTAAPLASDGNGLLGMRERMALFGGELAAGRSGAGFTVRARVPLETALE
jgi:signal transduction histidine kinase